MLRKLTNALDSLLKSGPHADLNAEEDRLLTAALGILEHVKKLDAILAENNAKDRKYYQIDFTPQAPAPRDNAAARQLIYADDTKKAIDLYENRRHASENSFLFTAIAKPNNNFFQTREQILEHLFLCQWAWKNDQFGKLDLLPDPIRPTADVINKRQYAKHLEHLLYAT